MLTGTRKPLRERRRVECEAYRSSEYDILDAAITMYHRIFPFIVVDVRRIICQSLSLNWDVGDLRPGLFLLSSFSSDPTLFWFVSRNVRVLSVSPISLIFPVEIIIRIVNLKDALLKKKKAEKGPWSAFRRPIS